MKKWMAVTGCILLLSGCAADPEQEKSGIPITNIQVENYFNLGENVQYFSKVPSRVLVIGASQTETLLDMGVEDSILWAVKYEDDKKYPIKDCNQAAFQRLNFLPRQQVTMERVLDFAPDLIISEESWFSKKSSRKHRVLERKRNPYFGVSEYNRTGQNKSAGNRGERNKIHP